jgi:hypothetical protein
MDQQQTPPTWDAEAKAPRGPRSLVDWVILIVMLCGALAQLGAAYTFIATR